jgi:hypothetical protein
MDYIVQLLKFPEAIKKISKKKPLAIAMSSEQWGNMSEKIRERAFFSAQIENARFLSLAQKEITDYISGTLKPVTMADGTTQTMLAAGDRATFVARMQRFALSNGMGSIIPPGTDREDRDLMSRVQDPASETRLNLIFDTQTRSATGYGYYKQGLDPTLLDAFPAARFVRLNAVAIPRPDHEAHEGEVRLKSDVKYWIARNRRSIGGFEVPWAPFGFNSGMGQEDVTREEAVQMGLLGEQEVVQRPEEVGFNDGLQASTEGMSDEMKEKLNQQFGVAGEWGDNKVSWKP